MDVVEFVNDAGPLTTSLLASFHCNEMWWPLVSFAAGPWMAANIAEPHCCWDVCNDNGVSPQGHCFVSILQCDFRKLSQVKTLERWRLRKLAFGLCPLFVCSLEPHSRSLQWNFAKDLEFIPRPGREEVSNHKTVQEQQHGKHSACAVFKLESLGPFMDPCLTCQYVLRLWPGSGQGSESLQAPRMKVLDSLNRVSCAWDIFDQ